MKNMYFKYSNASNKDKDCGVLTSQYMQQQQQQQTSNNYHKGRFSMLVERKTYIRKRSQQQDVYSWIDILASYLDYKSVVDASTVQNIVLEYVHARECNAQLCKCVKYRKLISHLDSCGITIFCEICGPVHHLRGMSPIPICKPRPNVSENLYITEDIQPASKRIKVEDASHHDDWSLAAIIRPFKQPEPADEDNIEKMTKQPETSHSDEDNTEKMTTDVLSFMEVQTTGMQTSNAEEPKMANEKSEMGCVDTAFISQSLSSDGFSILPEESPSYQQKNIELMTQAEHDTRRLENSNVSCVSLIDLFTNEQIEVHLCSLNPTNAEKKRSGGKMVAPDVGENTCQLCMKNMVFFAAHSIPCASCGAPIMSNSTGYWLEDENLQHCFCIQCFKESRSTISFNERSILKSQLIKGKNKPEYEEPWVQCDKCDQWQHKICALFNSEQDPKTVDYTCPFCRLKEMEGDIHVPIHPPSFEAQDLKRTKLSDHIEQRLFRSLEQDRKQRAEILGKDPEEVVGASDLLVRVVLAANKQLKVKQQFLDIFPNGTYPPEFPYKSKVILLFQKIEGVDVCLFAIYVQEFGSECSNPNKRSIYISYLDSVKYFRPEIKTSMGLDLRTFVYHEILIGYLDYCKKLGFETCYIWACPPLKGDDYLLNCHPEDQKRPNTDKLVHWYKKMIKKARAENVVVDLTNFYDHFFVPSDDSNSKITAARLPYFDGDYWSGAIEDIIKNIGRQKAQMTKRSCKAMGHSDLSKDVLVMQELGQSILKAKEEIMVVQLQFKCTKCNEAILCGGYWSCDQCTKFHLCDRCIKSKQFSSGKEKRHRNIHGEKHPLHRIPMKAAGDTEMEDVDLENNIFDDRHSFLDFCKKKYYQFDTLRRAKHSSMMILHHLHTRA